MRFFLTSFFLIVFSLSASAKNIEELFKFSTVEGGTFMMGSPLHEKNRNEKNEAQVEVTITKSFEMMISEVTQMQWFVVMGNNPSRFRMPTDCDSGHTVFDGVSMCPRHPVESVSWHDVQDFIAELNRTTGAVNCDGTPKSGKGCYRLPTEAEWEYVARAGSTGPYFFGDNRLNLGAYAWYEGNSNRQTHEINQKKANPWGFYDMYGNVWEWVQDNYSEELPGGDDPLVVSDEIERVARGGGWYHYSAKFRSANRYYIYPHYKVNFRGFRLVRIK